MASLRYPDVPARSDRIKRFQNLHFLLVQLTLNRRNAFLYRNLDSSYWD
jgi:hypothetical protein